MTAALTRNREQITFNLSGPARYAMLDGRRCLVVPTVMIVEGVLNGSQGPLLYRGQDLEHTPQLWNHKPIVLYHPDSGSASQAEVLNKQKIGLLLGTKWQAPKLRTEAWLDIEKCNKLDSRIIANLKAGKPLEVSTGLFTVNEPESGEFNGVSYSAIATRHQPDHLAVLPDSIGACSVSQGAGMGVWNTQHDPGPMTPKQLLEYTQAATAGWHESVRNALIEVLTHNASGRDRLIKAICSDRRNTFKKEFLELQPRFFLEGITTMLSNSFFANRRAERQPSLPNNYVEPVLDMPTMNFSMPGSPEWEREIGGVYAGGERDAIGEGIHDVLGQELWSWPDPSSRR